jgi:3-phosphoshikimate 1-carboxyvinyltransferase
MNALIKKSNKIIASITPPPDKSITHRAIMLASLAEGKSKVKNYLPSADCLATMRAFCQMGAKIKQDGTDLIIEGKGLNLDKPLNDIDCANSGTTARIMSGILGGQNFTSNLIGDASLSQRPMDRIIIPLSLMGVKFLSADNKLPMSVCGRRPLRAIDYKSDKASAQVKSAVLMAGLFADAPTTFTEPYASRDHTEKMLAAYGVKVSACQNSKTVFPPKKLTACDIDVPGDISSAAFFMAAALIVEGSEILIKDVGINSTRDGIIDVFKKMGADIEIKNRRIAGDEPIACVMIKSSRLKGIEIGADIMPRLIDEIPIIAICAAFAEGETIITGAGELRVKESDRIKAICAGLKNIGVEARELKDGLIISGACGNLFSGGKIDSFNDHRIAMAFAIAGLASKEGVEIEGADCVSISFPEFFTELQKLNR